MDSVADRTARCSGVISSSQEAGTFLDGPIRSPYEPADVTVSQESHLSDPFPGPEAVKHVLSAQEQVTRLEHGLLDQTHLVRSIEQVVRGFQVASMAARDEDEPAFPLTHIGQCPDCQDTVTVARVVPLLVCARPPARLVTPDQWLGCGADSLVDQTRGLVVSILIPA